MSIKSVVKVNATEGSYHCIYWNAAWADFSDELEFAAEHLLSSGFFKAISKELSGIINSVVQTGVEYEGYFHSDQPEGMYRLQIAPGSKAEVWVTVDAHREMHPSDILEGFFAQNLDLLCIADLKGHFLKLNPSWHSLLGYTDHELLGANFFDFIHPDDIDATHKAMADLKKQKSVHNFVNRYRSRSGAYKFLEWSAIARDEMIYATARDISDKVSAALNLKESKLFYESIISAMPDIIFVFDSECLFLYCHTDTSSALMMPPDLFLNKKASDVLPPELADLVSSGIQNALSSGTQVRFEYQLPIQNQLHWFEARMMPIANHKVVCIIRDVQAAKQALTQLVETGNILKRTAEMSKVGAWEVDLKEQKVYWTDITKAIHEVPDDYLPDLKSAIDFFKAGWDRIQMQRQVEDAVKDGKPYDAELILVTASGTEKWVRVWGMPEYINGVCTRFYGTIQDIDKFKRIELELENTRIRLEHLLTNMDDVVYSAFIPDYSIEYLNPSVWQLFGYTQEEMFAHNNLFWNTVIHPDDHFLISEMKDQLSQSGHADIEHRIITKNQEIKWVRHRSKYSVLTGDDKMRIEGIITDITTARLSVDAMHEARLMAEKASKAKTDFVARMSHEIRTPLNGIIGFMEMLKLTPLNSDQFKYLEYASSSADNLLHIVNDVLDFAKVEADMIVIDLQYVPLNELIEACLHMSENLANIKNLKLTFHAGRDLPDFIYTDPIRFKQVMNNLISNAVKFTEAGEIMVGFELVEKNTEGCILRFSVKDTGIGISEAAQQNIFKAFVQADVSTTRKYGGTGLGLVISQQLVDKLGGTLQLQSELNVGSTFSFELFTPFNNKQRITDSIPAAKPASISQTHPPLDLNAWMPNILLVDDMPMNRFLLSEMILNIMPGAHISNASDAEEAFGILEKSEFQTDLIFMDVQMPGMNGYDATRALKKSENPNIRTIPVYAVTAGVMENELEACIQAGMEGVITKPLSTQQIVSVLEKCLIPPNTKP